MKYILQHIEHIIRTYNGSMPLTYFLRDFFRQRPKLGSRDRKILSDMAYSWYRCSKGFGDMPLHQKLNACLYLCDTQSKHVQQFLPASWQETKYLPFNDKITLLQNEGISFNIQQLLPVAVDLSDGITKDDWLFSMLQQPRLFIRVRNKELVSTLLEEHTVAYEWAGDHCISIANGTPVDKILAEDSYAVQDASSQLTGNYFDPQDGEHWWDCCSGAGGKSLLLTDINENIHLTVSDKRETIIQNLLQRFQQYHFASPETHIMDVSDPVVVKNQMQGKAFDHIICDAPCTGSGTWARTPEQLYFFNAKLLNEIPQLQKNIAVTAAAYLKQGGSLIYITCSVFRDENEKVVEQIMQQTGLQLKEMHLLNGISQKADSMFITVLEKK
jgi:16S rRNA (cytosine967-C5)-methyltransferase